ncbi:MAG: magnesium transporter CorA family protein [Alphaproteobacteria bacterium]|nr:magnesium transporter CorA family protein [Alphaproteobacteria bacterium]
MLTVYARQNGLLVPSHLDAGRAVENDTVWVDLENPTQEEERLVEAALGLAVPTREEMQEIEVSSRLYQENGALFMTASVMSQVETERPLVTPISFILAGHRLVTIRYESPLPIRSYVAKAMRTANPCGTGEEVMVGILEAIVDRLADVLERVQHDMEDISSYIFRRENEGGAVDYSGTLRRIGRAQSLAAKARESLVSIGRLLTFVGRPGEEKQAKSVARTFKIVQRDILSLSDHASYLATNINFLLDATLGLINNDQTRVIKIFSLAAVIFLPPTLIASIYGMNFAVMPELDWWFGYPLALVMMVLSALVTYYLFKRRGWL